MERLPDLLESVARLRFKVAGVAKGARREVDFTSSGGSVSVSATDDSVNEKMTLDLAATSKQAVFFTKAGTLTTGVGTIRWRAPFAITIVHTRLAVNTAPTGAAILVDVNKNGVTLYTTQANRPTIAISANAETAITAPDITALAAGDYLSVDIDQVGSTIAGADLSIILYYTV